MKQWKPPVKGEFKVKPGRRVIWLSRPSKLSMIFSVTTLILVGMVGMGIGAEGLLKIYFLVNKKETQTLTASLKTDSVVNQTEIQERVVVKKDWGVIDDSLPNGRWLVIPSIGVKTKVLEEEPKDYEKALMKGVWRAQGSLAGSMDLNSTVGVSMISPFDKLTKSMEVKSKLSQVMLQKPELNLIPRNEGPLILVAHRYGYVAWSNDFRRTNSFYNLPKLKVGDKFEVWWDKKKYKLQINKTEKGKEISDYSGDVILYTCALLYGEERVFVYANLVE